MNTKIKRRMKVTRKREMDRKIMRRKSRIGTILEI